MGTMNQSIAGLDLEPIMVKLMDKEEGKGWSLDFSRRVAEEYRKYLDLCHDNPNAAIIPSHFVDDFWHYHILDTIKYQEDCNAVFGYFLHHFPYFGMRGEEDAQNLISSWEATISLYQKRFGVLDEEIWSGSGRCPNCGRHYDPSGYASQERPRLVS